MQTGSTSSEAFNLQFQFPRMAEAQMATATAAITPEDLPDTGRMSWQLRLYLHITHLQSPAALRDAPSSSAAARSLALRSSTGRACLAM